MISPVPAGRSRRPKPTTKCFGVAPAGQNDGANLADTHARAGSAKPAAKSGGWKYVRAGTSLA